MKTRVWMSVVLCAVAVGFVSSAMAAPQTAAKPAQQAVKVQSKFPKMLAPIVLKDGDSFVFLGDSITHQCLYTQYVEDFYYTRFPKLRIHFHNAGIGGDRAADALARFDGDVAAHKPRYVTILLGMNDGAYRDFDKQTFDTYQKGMTELLDRLAKIGAVAVPMTPTMHDSRAARMRKPAEPRDTYYNGVLALYGAWLREVAQARGLGFVDMYSPLNQLSLVERQKDANFTLIKDAVHPDAPGQVIMAAAILSDLCARSSVSSITLQEKAGALAAAAANGKLSDFAANGDTIRFTFLANALPWVLPAEAMPGYHMIHAGHRYGVESFSAKNLKPGKYELKIDGQSVGTWTDAQLAFRVELEANEKTPQYQQALRVAMLNKERNDQAVRPLRSLWLKVKVWNRQLAQQPSKKDAFAKWMTNEFQPGAAKLEALAKSFEDKIYQANQPVARKYELIRVK
jgi:lysophospholipase L1-like esterase